MKQSLLERDAKRRTTADEIFDRLREDIISLHLPPGTKLSEADIANRFDVSRQPVREALIRLSNMSLVSVRPQRATVVRKISHREITEARFIRMAVEVEIVRRACAKYTPSFGADFLSNLEQQKAAVEADDTEALNQLDYEFHSLMCVVADCEFAFKTIADNKHSIDRLCTLSLSSKSGQEEIYQDHRRTFECLQAGDEEGCVESTRIHLARLNETLKFAEVRFPDYFDK